MVRDEGLSAFFKGLAASLLREATYSTIRMGGYEVCKTYLGALDPSSAPLWKKITSGAIAGAFGAAIANPTDLVKVRMQADTGKCPSGKGPRYKNTWSAFKAIYLSEGPAGFFRGIGPTTQRAALLTAAQLSSYDHTKQLMFRFRWIKEDNIYVHFCASMVAGLVAAAVTSPVDVVKTRVMNQPVIGGRPTLYLSTVDCVRKTVKAEGLLSLYKGFVPNWIRI